MNIFNGMIITLSVYNQTYLVYENNQLSPQFDLQSYPKTTCSFPNLTTVAAEYESELFIVEANIQSQSQQSYLLSYQAQNIIDNDYNLYQTNFNLILTSTLSIYIYHQCPSQLTPENYWGLNKVTIMIEDQSLSFYYISLCDNEYEPIRYLIEFIIFLRFDFSYLIIILVGVFFIIILSKFGQINSFYVIIRRKKTKYINNYYCFKEYQIFQGFYINYNYIIVFILFILLLFGLSFIESIIQLAIISLLSTSLNIFYTIELCFYLNRLLIGTKNKIYLYSIGFILGIIPIILFYSFSKNWIANDFVFILNLGALFKLLKVTSFKDCITIYIPYLIFLFLVGPLIQIVNNYNTELAKIVNLSSLISLELPLFNTLYKEKCAFIDINTFFLPGLMIGYTYRYAKWSGNNVYTIVYGLGLFLGLIAWMFTTLLVDFPIPSLLFSVLPASTISILLAYKRNEHTQFWSGGFYDSVLLDPFQEGIRNQSADRLELISASQINPTSTEEQLIDDKLFDGLKV